MDKKRDKSLDIMKGILIILVVLGHIMVEVYAPETHRDNFVFKLCYSFHMPAFILLSGYFCGLKKLDNVNFQWLKKRTISMAIPYIIWVCLNIIVLNRTFTLSMLVSDILVGEGIWFLRFLIIADISFYLIVKVYKTLFEKRINDKYSIIVMLIEGGATFLIICAIHVVGFVNMKMEIIYYPFYVLGICIAKISVTEKHKKIFLNSCVILYPLSFILYRYGNENRDAFVNSLLMGNNSKILEMLTGMLYHVFCQYVVAILGTGFCYKIVLIISKYKPAERLCDMLSFLGLYTLQLYLLHSYLFFNLFESALLNSFVSVCTSIVGSMLIVYIVEKIPHLHKILFGR